MRNRWFVFVTLFVLAPNLFETAGAQPKKPQPKKTEHVITDFEGAKPVAASFTTHKANVTVVKEVPQGGGKLAARTVVDDAADATDYFGTGFRFPTLDLSVVTEIRFWIKTDIESTFNFQIHSDGNRTSVFRFSTVGSKL